MLPGDEVAFGVEAGLQLVISRGAVEVVADVVFAGPDDFDGSSGGAGNERGFDGVVLYEAPAEAAANEGDVHLDAVFGNAESLRDAGCRRVGNLGGRPQLAFAVAEMRGAVDGLHRGVREEGNFVVGFDGLGGTRMGLVEVTVIANYSSGLAGEFYHLLAKRLGAFTNHRRLVPLHFQAFPGLHGCPRRIRNDRDAGARVVAAARAGGFAKLMRHVNRGNFVDAADAGKRFQFSGVEVAGRAAVDGAAFHRGDEHSGNAGVDAEFGGAGDLCSRVRAAGGLTEKRKCGGIL